MHNTGLSRLNLAFTLFTFLALAGFVMADVPNLLNYQGRVTGSGVPFHGSGQFKFALVDGSGTATLWSNNGTSVDGSEPSAAVTLPVDTGLFSVLLGDTTLNNMIAISPSHLANPDARLRVWFNDGTNGFARLTPDQRLASAPYALTAANATTAASSSTSGGVTRYAAAPYAASAANAGSMYFNTAEQKMYYSDGSSWQALSAPAAPTPTYRWAVWHTYHEGSGWFFGNNTNLTAGVAPSAWTDNSARASQISSNKPLQAALFNKQAVVSPNSTVWAENYRQYSSTDGKMIGALFRVRNKTGSPINWTLYFYATGYGSWGENISVALNGVLAYANTGDVYPQSGMATTLTIPANRTSTVICVAGSSPTANPVNGSYTRSAVLAFYNNSLALPAGLEFIDDLNTATGGYEQ